LADKQSQPRGKARLRPPVPDANESRAAVATTVGWMLTVMSTLAGLFVAAAIGGLVLLAPAPAGQEHPLAALAGLMLLVSAATGVVSLALTVLAYRVRLTPPPRAITIAAVLIGLAPLVTIAVFAIRG
jgi:hypothetical protein